MDHSFTTSFFIRKWTSKPANLKIILRKILRKSQPNSKHYDKKIEAQAKKWFSYKKNVYWTRVNINHVFFKNNNAIERITRLFCFLMIFRQTFRKSNSIIFRSHKLSEGQIPSAKSCKKIQKERKLKWTIGSSHSEVKFHNNLSLK